MQRSPILAMNAFFLFKRKLVTEFRVKAMAEGGKKLSFFQIGEMWRALPEAQREAYKAKAKALNDKASKW